MNQEKTDHLNWQEKFEDFPSLPSPKLWREKQTPGLATREQIISQKLLHNISLSSREINDIIVCINFYKNLKKKLKSFDFSSLNNYNLTKFIGYIGYAYNYKVLIANPYQIDQTYRMVRNKDGNSKTLVNEISYPSLDVVKKKGIFNRANSRDTTMFYSCDKINSCFLELKPEVGEIVTIGIWKPVDKNKEITCYPIPSITKAQRVNSDASKSYEGLKNHNRKLSPLFNRHLDGYFDILNHEYSKKVNNPLEYVISAHFSEEILKTSDEKFDFGAILYPSVENNFASSNLAISPQTILNHFYPEQIIEMEILKTDYSTINQNFNHNRLTVATVRVIKEANSIDKNGQILWK